MVKNFSFFHTPSMFFLSDSEIPTLVEYKVSSKSVFNKQSQHNQSPFQRGKINMREKKVRGRWNKLPKIRQLKGETESRRDLLQESMAKLKSELEMKAKLRAKKQSRAEQSKAKIISSKRATTTTAEGCLCFWFEKGGTIFIGIGAHASTWGKGLHVHGWIEMCWLRRLCLDWEPSRMWAPRARDENRCEIAKSFFSIGR